MRLNPIPVLRRIAALGRSSDAAAPAAPATPDMSPAPVTLTTVATRAAVATRKVVTSTWQFLDRPAHKEVHGGVFVAVLLGVVAVVKPGYLPACIAAAVAGAVIGYYPKWCSAAGRLWIDTAERRRALRAAAVRWLRAVRGGLRTSIGALLRSLSETSRGSHVLVAAASALIVAHALWPHQFGFIAAVLGVGVAIGYYPTWRNRPRSTLSPDLRVASTLEGLIAGAFKLPASLPALAVVEIASDAHTKIQWVDGGISAVSGVGFVTTCLAIRSLRARRTRPLGKRQVLMSFAGVVVGLTLFAVAPDGLWLAVSLAITGLGVATNARFRNVIQAQYNHGAEAREFQLQTNIWTRRVTAIGLPLFGLMMTATPLRWQGTSLVVAGLFVVLAVLSVTVRRIPDTDHQKAQDEPPDDVSRLPSLIQTLLFVVLAMATAGVWRAGLEPDLRLIGVPGASFWTALVTFAGQVGTTGLQARLQRAAHRAPHQVALRASTLLIPAALLGPLTLLTPWWWIGIGVAAAWLMLGEAGQISSGSGTRIASSRVGTIGALYGTDAGYIGGALGAVLAGVGPARTPLGLGLLLGAGAVLSVAVAAWTPRVAVQEEEWVYSRERGARKKWVDVYVETFGRTLSLAFKRVDDQIIAVVSDERGEQGRLTLREAHQLRFTQRYRRGGEEEKRLNRSGRETYSVGRLGVWFGPAWWVITLMLWLTHASNRLGLLRPIAFAMGSRFHGVFRWTAEGRATAAVTHTGDEVRVDITFDRERALWITHYMPNRADLQWRMAFD